MPTLAEALDFCKRPSEGAPPRGEVVALIGSGGKTAALWRLAESLRRERVLVSTSVKMWPPEPGRIDRLLQPGDTAVPRLAAPGVTFADSGLNGAGKTGPFPAEVLDRLFPLFDVSLIEADGSRGLPFKGWAAHEPVLPGRTDHTLAILPLPSSFTNPAVGLTATEEHIHRLPLFLKCSGARAGEVIRPEHLAALIAHPRGLLTKARGRITLFFNQAESPEAEEMAVRILNFLPDVCRQRLWRVLIGSVRRDEINIFQP